MIEIPSCSFSEYYGSAASIKRMIYFMNVLSLEKEFPFQRTGRKGSDFDYARNMKQLGLVYQQDDAYFLTPRGESILIIDKLVDSKHKWKDQLIKFCILKSLADLDWYCITSLLWYAKVQKEKKLKELFCPLLSERNFNDHWLRLHLRLAEETDLSNHYITLYNTNLCQSNNVNSAHQRTLTKLYPYSDDFICELYFDVVETKLYGIDAKSFIQQILPQTLQLYSQFSENKEIGNIEPVKSLLHAYALKNGKFISEPTLSKVMLDIFLEKEIPLYRVLVDIQLSGRGIFQRIGNSFEFYPDFNLYLALQKISRS
ncbi:MAG: hypothetical protein QW279_13620 [Candidatus Jordarchaeaceae archaeon]